MAYSPSHATRGNRQRELEEGTRRTTTNSKMSYATGYLLRIGKDAAFGSPMRASGSHSLGQTTRRGSPLSDRTASPIRLKFGRRSPTSPLQDLRWGDGWEDHNESNGCDTASVVAALAKSRKRKTALPMSLTGEENQQHVTRNADEPSSKRRKQEGEEVGVVGHTKGSAFLPLAQSTLIDAGPRSTDVPSSLTASHSETSSATMEDVRMQSTRGTAPPLHAEPSVPSWHRLSTPPITQWKKLTLPNPNQLREEEGSTEAVAHDNKVTKSFPSDSVSQKEHAGRGESVGSVRSNTIRLPEILMDSDSISSSDEQSSTYTSRASTPLLDSSLQSSPISPNPKQQLLMRLRRRYTSGVSPAPVESWDRFKSRLLNKEDESGPVPLVKRQISREDMKKDHVRALTRVRSYLRQFSKEEQQQKAEEELKKKEDVVRAAVKASSLANAAVASSQPSTSGLAAASVSVTGAGVTQSQPTLGLGVKLPGLSLPTVSSSSSDGSVPVSTGVTGTSTNLTMPSLGALSQLGTTSFKMGDTAALSSASVAGPTGLPSTAAVGLTLPKVTVTASGTSSLLHNPLQSSTMLGGGADLSTSSSQALSGGKLNFSVPSTSASLASSVQLGNVHKTTSAGHGAPTLPTLATQNGGGLNLQFNAGNNPLQKPMTASNGATSLSFATATGNPLSGPSSSVLGSGMQVPQLGTAGQLTMGLGLGGIFPPAASTASLSTPAVSLSSTTTAGLFSQLGQTGTSSSSVNPSGSLFSASSSTGLLGLQQSSRQPLTAQPQSSLFATSMQGGAPSQAGGPSLFGGKRPVSSGQQSSMQPSGGGSMFGGLQTAQPSLFGNGNTGDKQPGLFNGSQTSQPGSIFGTGQTLLGTSGQGIQQRKTPLGSSGLQPSGSSMFGGQSISTPQSGSIFGNMTSSTNTSGMLPFNASSLSGAAQGTPPNFNFAAQSTATGSKPSQLGSLTGNASLNQPAQGISFSVTPQINFSANAGTPLGGAAPANTPASGRRPIARATRRSRRN